MYVGLTIHIYIKFQNFLLGYLTIFFVFAPFSLSCCIFSSLSPMWNLYLAHLHNLEGLFCLYMSLTLFKVTELGWFLGGENKIDTQSCYEHSKSRESHWRFIRSIWSYILWVVSFGWLTSDCIKITSCNLLLFSWPFSLVPLNVLRVS